MSDTALDLLAGNGSEPFSEDVVGIARQSEAQEPPAQLLREPRAPVSPGEAENRSQPSVEELSDSGNREAEPVLLVPKKLPETSSFKSLQMFEGTVQDVGSSEFTAALTDKLLPDEPEQVATIDIEHIWDSDRSLLAPGAVFYWSVGYEIKPHGQRSLVSNIRFRRLPAWTASELSKARHQAAEFDEFFKEE